MNVSFLFFFVPSIEEVKDMHTYVHYGGARHGNNNKKLYSNFLLDFIWMKQKSVCVCVCLRKNNKKYAHESTLQKKIFLQLDAQIFCVLAVILYLVSALFCYI